LQRAGRTFCLLPLELEQIFEIAVVPLRWIGSPAAFDAVGHRVFASAGAYRVVPAHAHRLDRCDLWRGSDLTGGNHAVALAEGVSTGDQRNRLLVVHRHAGESDADVAG
jgi:hypothetical protein